MLKCKKLCSRINPVKLDKYLDGDIDKIAELSHFLRKQRNKILKKANRDPILASAGPVESEETKDEKETKKEDAAKNDQEDQNEKPKKKRKRKERVLAEDDED